MSETASSDNLRTKVEVRNLFHLGLVIVFGIFATTLPQPQVLGRLPATIPPEERGERDSRANGSVLLLVQPGLVLQAGGRHSNRCLPALPDTPTALPIIQFGAGVLELDRYDLRSP